MNLLLCLAPLLLIHLPYLMRVSLSFLLWGLSWWCCYGVMMWNLLILINVIYVIIPMHFGNVEVLLWQLLNLLHRYLLLPLRLYLLLN